MLKFLIYDVYLIQVIIYCIAYDYRLFKRIYFHIHFNNLRLIIFIFICTKILNLIYLLGPKCKSYILNFSSFYLFEQLFLL